MYDLKQSSGGRSQVFDVGSGGGDGSGGGGGGANATDERAALRAEAGRLLERLFSGTELDSTGGGGLIDDDETAPSLNENSRLHPKRFLLHSTVDFPALAPASTPSQGLVAVQLRSIGRDTSGPLPSPPGRNATSAYESVSFWLDADDIFGSGGVRGLEAALKAFGGEVGESRGCAVFTAALWTKLATLFPRKYNLGIPGASERFVVVDESAGAPKVLEHLKSRGSRVVTNDHSEIGGRCIETLLLGSAPALRAANAALITQRTSPYLITGGSFVLL